MLSNNTTAPKFQNRGNIVLFASGSGTNTENVIRYFRQARVQGSVLPEPALVLTNNPNAGVLVRAAEAGVPARAFTREEFAEGTAILRIMESYDIGYIVLAGFMNKITAPLLEAYPKRILNIHPALLPRFGGKGMYGSHVHEAVLAAGERQSGITIHYINAHYDEGDILFQARCPVFSEDTVESLAARVHALEYAHYPRVIAQTFYGV